MQYYSFGVLIILIAKRAPVVGSILDTKLSIRE